jgi:hypothetical protein
VVVVSVLGVVAVATWTIVLVGANGSSAATSCAAPAGGPVPGQVLELSALDAVAPVPP